MLHAVIAGGGLITVNKSLEADDWPPPAPALVAPDCLVLDPGLPSSVGGMSLPTDYLHILVGIVFE